MCISPLISSVIGFAVLLWLASPGAALADDHANTNLFRAAAPADGYFTVEDPRSVARGALHVGATVDAGTQLLVIRDPGTQMVAPDGEVISERLALHLAAGLGVHDRLELGAAASVALQTGAASRFRPGVRSAALGDLRLRAKLRVWRRGSLGVAGAVEASLPTASREAMFGEATSSLTPMVVAGARIGRADLSVQLGYRFRGSSRFGDLVVDDELVAGIASRYPIAPRVWAQAEVYGAFGTAGKGNELERPIEALAGVRVRAAGPWLVQAGLGTGLTRGYGTPAIRGLVMVGYAPIPEPPRRARATWIPPETPDERIERVDPVESAGAPQPPSAPVTELRVVGDRLVLPASVLFPLDGADLGAEGLEVLAAVVQLWLEHPEWEAMVIEGHTDVRGDSLSNQRLSERRAHRVRAELIARGISESRLEAIGLGESRPVAPGMTEADHAKNRRVELVITRRREPAP